MSARIPVIDDEDTIRSIIKALARVQTTVLITGESGTGKELAAEALHRAGDRSHRPLVKVNCSALPETLLESELFGHVKGAFTGAIRDNVGRLHRADGGTIFFDEIGDISPNIQLRIGEKAKALWGMSHRFAITRPLAARCTARASGSDSCRGVALRLHSTSLNRSQTSPGERISSCAWGALDLCGHSAPHTGPWGDYMDLVPCAPPSFPCLPLWMVCPHNGLISR